MDLAHVFSVSKALQKMRLTIPSVSLNNNPLVQAPSVLTVASATEALASLATRHVRVAMEGHQAIARFVRLVLTP